MTCDKNARRGLFIIGLLLACVACQRSVPPNVTPPGETAAFSDPSPAAPAAPETETRK
ncbi:MAG: hypothetical protein ACKN9P_05445 [Phenylobacterium sp.]